MKTKKKYYRPWLTPTGVEIPTADLRVIVQAWTPPLWESYLKWFETGGRESLLPPMAYVAVADEQAETIFAQFAQDCSQDNLRLCERVLALLPALEAGVLRKYFLEGRTEVEIAFELKRSQTGINLIKNRALLRLKRENSGDGMFARPLVKDEISSSLTEEPSIWDEPTGTNIKEARNYDPENHEAEFQALKFESLRVALFELSESARRILYLRYWCDKSVSQTARILKRGVNVIDQIESASISKVKRSVLVFETGTDFGGV